MEIYDGTLLCTAVAVKLKTRNLIIFGNQEYWGTNKKEEKTKKKKRRRESAVQHIGHFIYEVRVIYCTHLCIQFRNDDSTCAC